ncbi:MAG: hypothetical protein O3B24_02560 [Verrucomicrobia bacterium]|nr:hypothetical protein [Verrucomicrobiota bacterium]
MIDNPTGDSRTKPGQPESGDAVQAGLDGKVDAAMLGLPQERDAIEKLSELSVPETPAAP